MPHAGSIQLAAYAAGVAEAGLMDQPGIEAVRGKNATAVAWVLTAFASVSTAAVSSSRNFVGLAGWLRPCRIGVCELGPE